MFVPVSIRGDSIDYESFETLAELAKDMEPPLSAIADRLREGIAEQFETQGAWGEEPWPELTEKYGRWKRIHAPGLPKLIGLHPLHKGTRQHPTRPEHYAPSGRMRLHLLTPTAFRVTRNRMLYAPQDNIAGFHQAGTSKMHARPPVAIPLREISEWESIFADWADSLLERTSL
jgi:hypothetical protein